MVRLSPDNHCLDVVRWLMFMVLNLPVFYEEREMESIKMSDMRSRFGLNPTF